MDGYLEVYRVWELACLLALKDEGFTVVIAFVCVVRRRGMCGQPEANVVGDFVLNEMRGSGGVLQVIEVC